MLTATVAAAICSLAMLSVGDTAAAAAAETATNPSAAEAPVVVYWTRVLGD